MRTQLSALRQRSLQELITETEREVCTDAEAIEELVAAGTDAGAAPELVYCERVAVGRPAGRTSAGRRGAAGARGVGAGGDRIASGVTLSGARGLDALQRPHVCTQHTVR